MILLAITRRFETLGIDPLVGKNLRDTWLSPRHALGNIFDLPPKRFSLSFISPAGFELSSVNPSGSCWSISLGDCLVCGRLRVAPAWAELGYPSWASLHFSLVAIITLHIRELCCISLWWLLLHCSSVGFVCISPWWLLLHCSFVAVLYYSLAFVIALLFVAVLCVVGCTTLSFMAVLSSLIVAASILYRLLFVELNCGLGRLFDFPGDKKGFSTLVFILLIAGIFAGKQVQNKVFILILILSFSNC